MGHNKTYKFLADAERYDADFLVVCWNWRCRRRVVIDRATLLAVIGHKRINSWVEIAETKMRCLRCDHRGATIKLTPGGSPQAIKLQPGAPLPPKGVGLVDWCLAADDVERKRLIRQARG